MKKYLNALMSNFYHLYHTQISIKNKIASKIFKMHYLKLKNLLDMIFQ